MSSIDYVPPQLQAVLEQRPLGLVFDIDGTLSPFAPTPEEARLYPGVADLLARAAQQAHVAIMTGRGIDSGANLVNVEGLTYIGTHGLEWSEGLPQTHTVQIAPEAMAYLEAGQRVLDLAERELQDLPGCLVERKRIGGTIHYRRCPDPVQARQRILAALEEPMRQANMKISEGKLAIEVRTPLAIDKGRGLRRFAQQFDLHGVVFAGDDRTDLDAIMEIKRLRQDGLAACAIAVQHIDTLPELLENADMVVQEVPGMVQLLRGVVELLTH